MTIFNTNLQDKDSDKSYWRNMIAGLLLLGALTGGYVWWGFQAKADAKANQPTATQTQAETQPGS